MEQFNVISSSTSTGYTGSIAKMLSLGGATDDSTLDRIEWGNFNALGMKALHLGVSQESLFTPTTVTPTTVVFPAGSYVDGPIGKVKTGTEGSWLIYMHK